MESELISRDEFPQLLNSIYLDNAGAALYNKSHVDNVSEILKNSLLTNPHSGADDESGAIYHELKQRLRWNYFSE